MQFRDAITQIKSVNKTDALTLASNFKVKPRQVTLVHTMCILQTFREIANLKEDDLALCPGFGSQKVSQFKKK